MRACQGHSVSHVRDELLLTALSVRDTPEYAAHGTYYDFHESILCQGLVAGGQQGQSFRRRVHMLEELPWEGAISGMRSDCDLAIWISAREAAAAGVQFYRSANSVLLMDATIDPAFFHSIQILRSTEVLTANGGPPDPQQVALAMYRASASDARSSEQYMAQGLLRHCHVSAGMCATSLPASLPCRTRFADPINQGRAVACILNSSHKEGCCDRSIEAHAPSCSGSHVRRSSSHTTSGLGGTACAHICTNRWIGPDYGQRILALTYSV